MLVESMRLANRVRDTDQYERFTSGGHYAALAWFRQRQLCGRAPGNPCSTNSGQFWTPGRLR